MVLYLAKRVKNPFHMCSYNSSYEASTVSQNRISIGNGRAVPQSVLDILRVQEQFTIHAAGYSMFPLIQQEDRILVRCTAPENISVGDIIAFEYPTQRNVIAVHRVIGIQRGGSITFDTKGDRSAKLDPIVTAELLIGKVVQVTSISGEIVDFGSASGWLGNIIITFVQISSIRLCALIRIWHLPFVFERMIILFWWFFSHLLLRFIRSFSNNRRRRLEYY